MSENAPVMINEVLLHATVKWNTRMFAGICGLIGALTLLCMTYLSLFRGMPDPGHYLSLLGLFLPGYTVSAGGAWVGFLWGGLIGAVSGAMIYRIYARSIPQQVADYFAGNRSIHTLENVVLKLHGHSLGLALGSLAALGLLITTNWLVVRGTADESVHAALLSQYLPGYTVSTSGSILGAVEIFVIIYLFCVLLSVIYNGVVALRQNGAAS
ncbi:MAG: hypothetical protein OER43_02040 [Gammaproteobacteria bacterium]|nr:hypothetical protein [Gammaproteobacteria bacterium]MDH3410917.1 hypothetical protein [Gammaproteobacteria bacterium]